MDILIVYGEWVVERMMTLESIDDYSDDNVIVIIIFSVLINTVIKSTIIILM